MVAGVLSAQRTAHCSRGAEGILGSSIPTGINPFETLLSCNHDLLSKHFALAVLELDDVGACFESFWNHDL